MGEGQAYTPSELLKKALRYKNYWGDKGGITVSGGEPLLQIDFLTEFFRLAKEAGVHTTLDTSANPLYGKRAFLFQMAGADEVYRSCSSGYQAD